MLSGVSTVDEIKAIADPAERAKALHAFVLRGKAALDEARELRDGAIGEWRAAGATQRQIAEELRVTPGLIGQVDPTKQEMSAMTFGSMANGDRLFDADGNVKLPRFTGLAISIAAAHGGLLSRQPTQERAQAIADAVHDQVEQQGRRLELRESKSGLTVGVYVVQKEG